MHQSCKEGILFLLRTKKLRRAVFKNRPQLLVDDLLFELFVSYSYASLSLRFVIPGTALCDPESISVKHYSSTQFQHPDPTPWIPGRLHIPV